jgi:hypothetical protein
MVGKASRASLGMVLVFGPPRTTKTMKDWGMRYFLTALYVTENLRNERVKPYEMRE